MCKVYGVGIIISESVKNAVSNDYYFRYLDDIKVYGKDNPIKIYAPMYKQDAETMAEEFTKYDNAIKLYLSMNFKDALNELSELLANRPDSKLYKLYISRARHFIDNPPSKDWDGCFTFESK
jgi:adenylate cyclase